MWRIWPSQRQWKRWTLPSKLTVIGCLLALVALLADVGFFGIIRSMLSARRAAVLLVEGVLPLHLSERTPIPDSESHFVERRLGFIAKVRNESDVELEAQLALLEGCVGIDPIAAELMLPPLERLPDGTKISEFFSRHKHTVQRIRASGLVRPDLKTVPARGVGYVGILFPLSAGRTGALPEAPGSISLDGDCDAVMRPSTQPSALQVFAIASSPRRHVTDIADEIRDGRLRLSISIGGTVLVIDPLAIRELISIRWRRWESLSLAQMYEVPDPDWPPVQPKARTLSGNE